MAADPAAVLRSYRCDFPRGSMALPRLAPHSQPETESRRLSMGQAPRPPRVRWSDVLRILALGLLLELLLILSFIPAPLVPETADSGMDELVPRLQILGQPMHQRMLVAARWLGMELAPFAVAAQVLCFLALFVPYGVALVWLRRAAQPALGYAILLFGGLFELTALCSRRMYSTDLFSYILNGRILLLHGGDPYVDMPALFADDPYLPLVVWREIPNHYGPLWTFASVAVSWLGGENFGLTLFLFRLVSALATVGVAVLVWRFLRRARPEYAPLGVAVWAWNPLVIVEGAGSGHNDPVLALLLVLAVTALSARRVVLGLLAVTSAVLVKYSAAVLAPLYLALLIRRESRRTVLLAAAAACTLTVISFLPFIHGDRIPAAVYVSSPARYLNSPTELLYTTVRGWLGDDTRLRVETVEFRPWWATIRKPVELLLERGRIPIGQVHEGAVVLSTNRPDPVWQRVYDPWTRQVGFVPISMLRATARPANLPDDPELVAYERTSWSDPVAEAVNRGIRVGGALVVLAGLVLLLRSTRTTDELIGGWLRLLILLYWFVATWFFPWYLIWGLGVAALRPRGPLVWALVVWSASVLLYYGIAPFEYDPELGWLYRWRSIPMFLPPLLVLGWYGFSRRRRAVQERGETSSALGAPVTVPGTSANPRRAS
jgi:hypothetical protein